MLVYLDVQKKNVTFKITMWKSTHTISLTDNLFDDMRYCGVTFKIFGQDYFAAEKSEKFDLKLPP